MGSGTASARRQFDAWSKSYDRSILQRILFAPTHVVVDRRLRVPLSGTLLDLGCGTARFADFFLARHPQGRYIGVDLSPKMLERAALRCQAYGSSCRLFQADAERLPVADQSVDAVICLHSFHHHPSAADTLAEMRRVLKPGGQSILVDGDRDRWWGWLVFAGFVEHIEKDVHHYSASEFRRLFTEAGFSAVRQTSHGWIAPFLVNDATAGEDLREASVRTSRRRRLKTR